MTGTAQLLSWGSSMSESPAASEVNGCSKKSSVTFEVRTESHVSQRTEDNLSWDCFFLTHLIQDSGTDRGASFPTPGNADRCIDARGCREQPRMMEQLFLTLHWPRGSCDQEEVPAPSFWETNK